jgi:DNA-binding transcriptional ArsR family regulator
MSIGAFLDLSPVPAPGVRQFAAGVPEEFTTIVTDAALKNVVSMNTWPDIRIHGGRQDFKVVSPGKVIYCIAGPLLPSGKEARAREILRRLAYGYHDWAAREVVARYHRDLKRPAEIPQSNKTLPASVRIRRYLRNNPSSTVGEIATATGIAQPNVSRTIAQWAETGHITIERNGRETRCTLAPPSSEDMQISAIV